MMKTAVVPRDGWWFTWRNMGDEVVIARGLEGPFATEQDADLARENFAEDRKRKYPWELVE